MENQMISKSDSKNESKSESEMLSPLNFDCLHEIFKYLSLNDCINAVEADNELQSVADTVYKSKCAQFSYDFLEPIERVFDQIGSSIISLTLVLNNADYTEEDIIQIQHSCTQMKRLTLVGFDRFAVEYNPFAGAEKVEELSLVRSNFRKDINFFYYFSKLKSLNLNECKDYDYRDVIGRCFKNNTTISSFTCRYGSFNSTDLLMLLPNLERLCLHYNEFTDYKILSKLNRLTSLSLNCPEDNVNHILSDLSSVRNTLQELELINVTVDGITFERINGLNNLQLLAIQTRNTEFSSSFSLTTNVRTLKLKGFRMNMPEVLSLIKQQKYLENMQLANLFYNNGKFIGDFHSIADMVIASLNPARRINVVINETGDNVVLTTNSIIKQLKADHPFNRHGRVVCAAGYYVIPKMVSKGNIEVSNFVQQPEIFKIFYPGDTVEGQEGTDFLLPPREEH